MKPFLLALLLGDLLAQPAPLPSRDFPSTRGLVAVTASDAVTVVIFFAVHCPIQRAHDRRLRALYERYQARGVRFLAVDAEVDSTPEADQREATARSYPFPIVSDPAGAIADALHAEYATQTVVLDRRGIVRYSGGIDGHRYQVPDTDDDKFWLKDALDAVLTGKNPENRETKSFGCALRRH